MRSIARLTRESLRPQVEPAGASVFICIADHFEPMWRGADKALQQERVDRWITRYPQTCSAFRDSRGQVPQHTFFYPIEEYDRELVGRLADFCRRGWGSLEFHLHHDGDSPQRLRDRLEEAKREFHDLGTLRLDAAGRPTFGFVHGNWALCNARPDGRWCGVNDELTILREAGCYADFTLPAVPDPSQIQTINSIYYARSSSDRPRGHEIGTRAAIGIAPPNDSLLLVQGPLLLDWARRKAKVFPGIENGELHGGFAPTLQRLQLWLRAGIRVLGRPDWVFIKLHTHGAPERNADMLLGEPMRRFHADLAKFAERFPNFRYYYVNAREMAELVHLAESEAIEPRFSMPIVA
jgi:hypothetical protein